MIDIPDTLPLFPLDGAIILPRAQLPLRIFEPKYVALIDYALKQGHRMIGMVQPTHEGDGLHETGCIGKITSFSESGEGQYFITLNGICRFTIEEELPRRNAFREAVIKAKRSDFKSGVGEADVDRDALISALKGFLRLNNMDADWEDIKKTNTELLVNALSVMSPWGLREKQALLESDTLKHRADLLIALSERSVALDKSTKTSAPRMLQ
jgi:uncharacterized protein